MIQWFSSMKHFNPETYELWFETLAEQGYEPQITPLSFIAMRFEKGPVKKVRYVIDVQVPAPKDYIPKYQGAGWELVGKMANMYVWRKEYSTARPEAFSDVEAVRNRNKRYAKAITVSMIMAYAASIIFWIGFVATRTQPDHLSIGMGVGGVILFLIGTGMLFLSITIARSKVKEKQ